jgi:glycosyltransferase involved in cell wall biosynthesis
VFVDDNSRDGTASIVRAATARDERISSSASRNYGQRPRCKRNFARDEALDIQMDGDLQIPEELVSCSTNATGLRIVYGVR